MGPLAVPKKIPNNILFPKAGNVFVVEAAHENLGEARKGGKLVAWSCEKSLTVFAHNITPLSIDLFLS